MEVLQAIGKNPDPRIIYPILAEHQDKLTLDLASILQQWTLATLSETKNPNRAYNICANVGNFANLIRQFPLGNRTINLEIAITANQSILSFFTRSQYPVEWAATQNNLAIAYYTRLKGDRAENIEIVIQCFLLVLEVRTRKDFREDWARTQNNLADAYYTRLKGDRAENIETAIKYYQIALEVYTREDFRENWAGTQFNLASVYYTRLKGDRAENIETAIKYYQIALEVYTREDFRENWAMTQKDLATAYYTRLKGDRAENIETAIKYYQITLEVYTREDFREQWAMTQKDLATAYYTGLKGNRAENIEMAIKFLLLALEVFTREDFREQWAGTQNNLAITYSDRLKGNRAENIETAIKYYQLALEVYTREDFREQWAMTQNNLANAYEDRLKGDRAENIETALKYYQLALEVRTREDFREQWAMTQVNLASAYYDRLKGDRAENIETALKYYQIALEVFTREDFREKWATTQNNLATAYSDRLKGDRAENIEMAIQCYLLALEVRTSEAFPNDCLKTGRNLGNLGFTEGNWEIAIEGYSQAIEAVETSRSWAKEEARREEIQAESIEIYGNIVQAYIQLNQYTQAFAYVERSRSKRLLDLMHVHDSYKNGEIPPEVQQILDQLDYHQSEIDKIYHPYNQNHNLTTADTLRRTPKEQEQAKIDYHRREINRLYQEIRQRDPLAAAGTRVPTINVNTAAQLLQNSTTTALLNFFSTKENTYIFIIRHNRQSKELRVDLHTLTDQGITNFHNWIFEEWIVKSKYNRQQWETNAQNFLTELSQKLQINHLITNHLQGITELILIPHLYLHQIPFIALLIDPSITLLPEREGVRANYLGDHFTLRYAPSCQVLQFCQARDHIPEPLTYGLVAGASRDVPYANFQGSEITKLCKIPSTKQLNGISQTTKTAYKQLLHQANIFYAYHHANFDFAEPLNASLTVADGDILLAQILTWRLPNLSDIFLSCCETGLGLSQKLTDDIFTIASGFLCVGARNVFSTLWSVEQLSAALICVLYYRDRSENPHHRKAQSLQIAQTQLREMTGEQLETEFADALQQSIHDYINQLRDYALSLPEGTAERNTANQNLKQSQSLEIYLYTLCSKDHPFENPTYWAAFTCQGLG